MRSSLLDARRLLLELALFTGIISPIAAPQSVPTLRSESTVVLVPTLVRTKAGEIIYGLQANDFLIEDNGIEQPLTLDDSPEREPVSLVVAIQVGRQASSQFKKKSDLSLYDRFYSEAERKDCRLRRRPRFSRCRKRGMKKGFSPASRTMSLTMHHAQVRAPRAYRPTILMRHDSRNLMQVCQIMRRPRCQELGHRHRA